MRGNVNDFPILMVTGFFDVESRGPFQVFQELHDRQPQHHLLRRRRPRRRAGRHRRRDGRAARLVRPPPARRRQRRRPRTRPSRSGWPTATARTCSPGASCAPRARLARPRHRSGRRSTSTPPAAAPPPRLNDGTLSPAPSAAATQSYVAVPSLATATDPHSIATVGVFNSSPALTDLAPRRAPGAHLHDRAVRGGPRARPDRPALELLAVQHRPGDRPARRARPTWRPTAPPIRWPPAGSAPRTPRSTSRAASSTPTATSCSPTVATRPSRPPRSGRSAATRSSCGRSATASAPATGSGSTCSARRASRSRACPP